MRNKKHFFGVRAAAPLLFAVFAAALLSACSYGGDFRSDSRSDFRLPDLDEAAGQMLIVGVRCEVINDEIISLLYDLKPGGIILFDYDLPSGGAEKRNISSPSQLKKLIKNLQALSRTGLFIAADVEGGKVNRLKPKYGFSLDIPPAKKLGFLPESETYKAAEKIALELRSAGINFNFAPVADVDINPQSPAIGHLERSFSRDPQVVASHVAQFARAHRENRVITALKHFPGHGSATEDTHLGVADVTGTYNRSDELTPYRLLITEGYDGAVMTAHIINKKLDDEPATLSRKILSGLLRGGLGFKGVIVSDDMQMGAIVKRYGLEQAVIKSINAGVDIVIIGNQIGEYDKTAAARVRDAIVRAVETGVIPRKRIYRSYKRIMEIKKRYGIVE
ncbi:MAG: glycoside hydrolase family 3 [Candidatus Mycalebacterium zealandia]|nr:MAG: glycoside hydrolase family 3 [Candidatus Mycalebacterium zealandia]